MTVSSQLSKRTDELLQLGHQALATEQGYGLPGTFLDATKFSLFRSAALSFLAAVYTEQHSYFREFDQSVRGSPASARKGIGILSAVKNEVQGNWLFTIKGLVAAEIFAGYLEMAQHLLSEGYKDPAAVLAGSTLEEHLRRLAAKSLIPLDYVNAKGDTVAKRADSLNSELAKAGAYNLLDMKSVTGWLDLRNKAAHGHYSEFTAEQVAVAIRGITDFAARTQPQPVA